MKIPQVGPAFLVTAAFIGPGTVITATIAGANFGYSLLWALLFSVIATIILQEMAARLGVVTQQGLGENIRQSFDSPLAKLISILLIVSAIAIGNAAYQSGNISGASLGLEAIVGQVQLKGYSVWPAIIGTIALIVLWQGSYRLVEKVLVSLVATMSIAFVVTFIYSKPDIASLFSGLLVPSLPLGSTLTAVALIGTTVVPYNLFLHAATAHQKWQKPEQLGEARKDLYISIPLGGIISIAIVSTAASAFFGQQVEIQNIAQLAPSLQPVFGENAKIFIAVGLFAAGISSAVTAPLAAAYAVSGILNLNQQLKSTEFKLIWLSILLVGTIIASIGYRPVSIIWFAQVTNGILLPVICIFLFSAMNSVRLGQYRNTRGQNFLAAMVIIISLLLSGRSLMSAFGLL